MKKLVNIIMLLGLLLSANAKAESAANALLYIQPYEYKNPIKLQYAWREYWFTQGDVVEPIAIAKLEKITSKVATCEGNQTGKVLFWLQPRMFYNGQVKLFFGKITVNVYSGVGKLVHSYSAEAKQFGSLEIAPEASIKKAYTTAMDAVIKKMQADKPLQNMLNTASSADTPCSMVSLLPQPKVRAMAF